VFIERDVISQILTQYPILQSAYAFIPSFREIIVQNKRTTPVSLHSHVINNSGRTHWSNTSSKNCSAMSNPQWM